MTTAMAMTMTMMTATTTTTMPRKPPSMNILLWTIVAFLCASSVQAAEQNIPVEMEPAKQVVVRLGQELNVLCKIGMPIEYCRFEIAGQPSIVLKPGEPIVDGTEYYGKSLEAGQCGIHITQIKEIHDGMLKCNFLPRGARRELNNTLKVIVARPPSIPELLVSSANRDRVYQKGDRVEISCFARGGRPPANISLFLDDEQLISDMRPNIYDQNVNETSLAVQNFSRVLEWTDNGKTLRCVADHIALTKPREITRQLDVEFAPLPQSTIEQFGFVVGLPGTVNVTVQANPRPSFRWFVGDEMFEAGQHDSENHIETSTYREIGKGTWLLVLTINNVQKSDTEKKYYLEASNTLGSFKYQIVLSTSTEPEGISNRTTSPHAHAGAFSHFYGVDLDAGSIIGIVVGALILLLLVFLIIFARATGRWCFAGGSSSRTLGESDIADPAASVSLLRFRKPKPDDPNAGLRSDTESAGRYSKSEVDSAASSARRRRPKITFAQLFKRNKDKVSGADTDTVRTVVTVDDEKIQTSEAPPAVTLSSANPAVGEGGLVYAELDLAQQKSVPPRRIDNDTTEYAEIIYTKPEIDEAANIAKK